MWRIPRRRSSSIGLSKVYVDGTHAPDALELRLPAGSFFGLLGPAPARPALL
jgi:hypothetical protein